MEYAHSTEFKFRDTDSGKLSGHAAVFGNVDHGGDRIAPGAFRKSIASKRAVPMLLEHAQTIGVWSAFREDQKGLLADGRISDTTAGRDARTLAKDGAISGLSIGYRPVKHGYDGNVRVLKEVELLEVSLVTFPMNDLARVSSAKSALMRGETPEEEALLMLLRERGFSRRKAKIFLSQGYSGLRSNPVVDLLEGMATRLED